MLNIIECNLFQRRESSSRNVKRQKHFPEMFNDPLKQDWRASSMEGASRDPPMAKAPWALPAAWCYSFAGSFFRTGWRMTVFSFSGEVFLASLR